MLPSVLGDQVRCAVDATTCTVDSLLVQPLFENNLSTEDPLPPFLFPCDSVLAFCGASPVIPIVVSVNFGYAHLRSSTRVEHAA